MLFQKIKCPNCGEIIDGYDLDGEFCPDCAVSPSCHHCQWPDNHNSEETQEEEEDVG